MKYLCLYILLTCTVFAEEWPTYKYDNHRSGVTSSTIDKELNFKWRWESPVRPQTAWSGPAKWDAYTKNTGLQSLRNFDPAFFVTGKDNDLYFGSSVDNAVHCIDKNSGKEKWVFFSEGQVGFPRTLIGQQLVFGSDDGCVYSIDLNGQLQWKYEVVENGRKIASNGKLISMWPVRTGILNIDDTVYFAASLVPWEKSYVCALNLKSGKQIFKKEHGGITLEGAILSAAGQLIIPQGRASALMFSLKNGSKSGNLGNAGGTFILATDDDKLITGPKNQKGKSNIIHMTDAKTKTNMLQLNGIDRMIIDGEFAYYHQNNQVRCMNRSDYASHTTQKAQYLREKKELSKKLKNNKEELKSKLVELDKKISVSNKAITATSIWQTSGKVPISFIKAGDKLICGLDGLVQIYDSAAGELLKEFKITGRAYGLAVWNGSLIVSSDDGSITCFGR
ncbi:MAG: PQQ-binding-like beta-propeller repeat protein [Lentisphaeraceae bacterium]|nr:PQQ-binding-like beta-propeller repeat protein [Lentisphaeraceae bacterium]